LSLAHDKFLPRHWYLHFFVVRIYKKKRKRSNVMLQKKFILCIFFFFKKLYKNLGMK
jgi:hypothetical protein